jgi:hypothetical protein
MLRCMHGVGTILELALQIGGRKQKNRWGSASSKQPSFIRLRQIPRYLVTGGTVGNGVKLQR